MQPSYELREGVVEDTSVENLPPVDDSTVSLGAENVELVDEAITGSTGLPREKHTNTLREVPNIDEDEDVILDRLLESERRDVDPDELTSNDDNSVNDVGEALLENVDYQKDTLDGSETQKSNSIDEPVKQGSIADFFHKFSPHDEFADDETVGNHEDPVVSQNQREQIDTTADGSLESKHEERPSDSSEEVESEASKRSNDRTLGEDEISPDNNKQSETDEVADMTLNLVDIDETDDQDPEHGNSGTSEEIVEELVNAPSDVPLGSNSSIDDHSLSNVTKWPSETNEPADPSSDNASSNHSTIPDPKDSLEGGTTAEEQRAGDVSNGMTPVSLDPNNSSLPHAIPLNNGSSVSDDSPMNKTKPSKLANTAKHPSNITRSGTQRSQSTSPVQKGSLAEFVRKAKSNIRQGAKEGPIRSSAATLASSTSEKEPTAAHTTDFAASPLGLKTEATMDEHIYNIPVWGTTKDIRTQPSLPVLHQLFQDPESWERYFSENPPNSRNSTTLPKSKNATERQPSDHPVAESNLTESEGDQTIQNQPSLPTNENGFVNGLDDIDKLFEDIDPPDDLDVAGDGTSIREVLMGSATRVLLKRFRRTAGFIRARTVLAAQWVNQRCRTWWDESEPPLSWLQNKQGDWAPFRAMRNSDGHWAPLRYIRTVDGEFAPLQRVRNEDGEIPWGDFTRKTFQWMKTTAIGIYEQGETLLDRWFEGPEVDDADFDFFDHQTLS